jgi:hypothetical protein
LSLVIAKRCDRVEVRVLVASPPEQVDVPLHLPLWTTAGAQTTHRAIDVECEWIPRAKGGTPSYCWLPMSKAERWEFATLDQRVHETHRIISGNIVIKND